jgi:D-glycero-beta-D-manno-heptose-7-phosphate kinase
MAFMPLPTPAELDVLFQRLASKSVLVVGDAIVDEYVTGEVNRISPEAPVPVVEFRSRAFVPGGAANVAANIAALGGRALLCGVVGTDVAADELRAALERNGVRATGLVPDQDRPTTVKLRILAHGQQIVRLDREVRASISASIENTLLAEVERRLGETDMCILSDYGKGTLMGSLAAKLIAMCRNAGIPILVDPKSLDIQSLRGATLVKPNRHEAERLAGCEINSESAYIRAGRSLAAALVGSAVLITRGPLGMSLFQDGNALHVKSAARKVFDVTGAGDTVIAMLACAMACGWSLPWSMVLANVSASIAVEKLGTATVTRTEVAKLFGPDACDISS